MMEPQQYHGEEAGEEMQVVSRAYNRWMLGLFVCLFFVLSSMQAADAAEQSNNRTVKAGVFYFDGYHMEDEEGNLSGYGIEFLNLVSEYSHLNFTYTGYDKSWYETVTMLENGDIDVVTSAKKTPEREEKFAFSLPIGKSRTFLSVRENNSFRSGDYKSYDGMIVGMIVGRAQKKMFEEFAEEKGFTFRTKEFENSQQLAKALRDGSVDAILTSDIRKINNVKALDTVSTDNFYAIVRKEDTQLLDEINYAIEQMNINEGDWSNVMFYKYYGPANLSALEFDQREKDYIEAVLAGEKKITATAMGDCSPYSFVEDGKLKGILPDYLAKVMEQAGLSYEMEVPQDKAAYYDMVSTNSVDVVIDRRMEDTDIHIEDSVSGGFYTDAYMAVGMAKVTRKDLKGEAKTVAIAENQEDELLEQGTIKDARVLKYATREDALQAVLDGGADAAYVYPYTAQMFVSNDATDSLNYSIVNGFGFDFCMYVRNSSDHELVTILNKCIRKMPADVMNQLIAKYTSNAAQDISLVQYMRANPMVFAIVVLVCTVVLVIIIFLVRRAAWNRKVLDAVQSSQKELEQQFAIVNALSRDYINIFAVNTREALVNVIKAQGYVVTDLKLDMQRDISYTDVLQEYITERVYPEDQQYLLQALSLTEVREQLNKDLEYTGSYRVLDGADIHVFQFTYIKMADSSQDEEVVLLGFRNIDEIVRKEQEQKEVLAEALAEAQHANFAKTAFLNNMSHDMRTPMNAIIGFTSLAASHIESRDLVQSYLDKIMTSSKHLLSLINDVLDMSRIESGKMTIDEKEASLPEIMHDLKTIVQSDIKAKQLEFYIDTVDVANETVICDKLRLNQVLLNILSNAMKYTRPGGMVSLRIIQKNQAPKGFASYEFRVKDNGIGMSKDFLQRIFDPFEREQTSTVSGIQGTGLGLAITKNIVDMMNGTITVESEEGEGSEFTVSFQFRVANDPAVTERLEELVDLRALVVDDDINTCMSVSKMLTSIGMRPDWTTQGKEAVVRTQFALEQNEPYSTYIIDWLMPDLNGIEIVRRIRRIIGDAPAIIILTAYDWADVEEEAKEAGVTAFCSKPIFLSELRGVLAAPFMEQQDDNKEEVSDEVFVGKKLLLVEDNEINQEIAVAILEEKGFVLDVADDGSVAVDIMKKAPQDAYDLILMDIQMIHMNGYDAARAIRALDDPVKSQIPIVAMTANAFEEDRQMALDAGMNGHVSKPIDVGALLETLKELLKDGGLEK